MLSENIYALRRRSGLSQEQLAERIGVSRQAISKWEGGLSVPELDKLRALSECFQVTIDELVGEAPVRAPGGAASPPAAAPSRTPERRAGVGLCLAGAAGLLLLGVLAAVRPPAVSQIGASSAVTLNGTGILAALLALLLAAGVILILKKK